MSEHGGEDGPLSVFTDIDEELKAIETMLDLDIDIDGDIDGDMDLSDLERIIMELKQELSNAKWYPATQDDKQAVKELMETVSIAPYMFSIHVQDGYLPTNKSQRDEIFQLAKDVKADICRINQMAIEFAIVP